VGQLVTDGSTRVAVVGRVIHLRIVKRGLQYACGEIDVVHARVVIGVNGRRRHRPFAAINWFAYFIQPAPGLELRRPFDVAGEIVARYCNRSESRHLSG